MTDEELTAIQTYWNMTQDQGYLADSEIEKRLHCYVGPLLAEVERLRADAHDVAPSSTAMTGTPSTCASDVAV